MNRPFPSEPGPRGEGEVGRAFPSCSDVFHMSGLCSLTLPLTHSGAAGSSVMELTGWDPLSGAPGFHGTEFGNWRCCWRAQGSAGRERCHCSAPVLPRARPRCSGKQRWWAPASGAEEAGLCPVRVTHSGEGLGPHPRLCPLQPQRGASCLPGADRREPALLCGRLCGRAGDGRGRPGSVQAARGGCQWATAAGLSVEGAWLG